MGALIGMIGMLGFIICLVLLLIRFIKKQPKKLILLVLLVCFVLFVVGIAITPTPQDEISDISQGKEDQNLASIEKETEDDMQQQLENGSNKDINKDLKVHFIDVGQADSIFIDFNDTDILIDGGNNEDGLKVVNYLRQLKVDDIEIMIGTHPHEDHIGSLDDVLKAFNVETIIDSGTVHTTKTYESYINASSQEENKGAKILNDKDMTFDLGNNAVLKIIETVDESGNLNDDSVVSILDYGDIEFLFTGDMEQDIELKFLEKFSDIDVLKVSHHGSSTSSSNKFLDKIKPEYAVISVGQDNRYGHPHSETLWKFKERGTKVFRTDEQGSIVVTTDGINVTFNTDPSEN